MVEIIKRRWVKATAIVEVTDWTRRLTVLPDTISYTQEEFMLCGLQKRIPLRLNHAIGLILLLSLLSIVFGACAARLYPEPGTPYENRAIGYEFSFEQTDDSVEIDLRNISDDILDVATIGFYAIDGGGIRPIDALAIGDRQLDSQAATHISFPKEGEGFIIMNAVGSFVTGAMFEVRYQ